MDGLGDKTPSQCMTLMLNLVPTGEEPGFLFRELFLRQLPSETRTQLVQSTNTGTSKEALRQTSFFRRWDPGYQPWQRRPSTASSLGRPLQLMQFQFPAASSCAFTMPNLEPWRKSVNNHANGKKQPQERTLQSPGRTRSLRTGKTPTLARGPRTKQPLGRPNPTNLTTASRQGRHIWSPIPHRYRGQKSV